MTSKKDTQENDLVDHYGNQPIVARIDAALAELGVDPQAPSLESLKPVDEFHTGGIEATKALLDPLGISADTRVLDIGCGIGGTARYIAHSYGAQVTGVDLTPDYVAAATDLTQRVGLADLASFHLGSALALPVDAAAFDLVTMFHVGMNIADKPGLFGEVARVLAPGGRFALFDVMLGDGGGTGSAEIGFPVPWSPDAAHSFVVAPSAYRDSGRGAGLDLIHECDRGDFARDFFARAMKATQENGVPPVGLHLLMGQEAGARYGNAIAAANDHVTAPWEMVFRKPE